MQNLDSVSFHYRLQIKLNADSSRSGSCLSYLYRKERGGDTVKTSTAVCMQYAESGHFAKRDSSYHTGSCPTQSGTTF